MSRQPYRRDKRRRVGPLHSASEAGGNAVGWRTFLPDRGAGRTLALVALIDATGTGFFLAGAAIYFIRSLGLSAAQVGLGLSVAGAVGFATTVPVGVLGDRLGARRLLLIVQLWRAVCLLALVFVSDFVAFTLVATLQAIGETATPSLTQAVVASAFDSDTRVRNMAVMRSTRNVGFSLGALAAAPLIAVGSGTAFRGIVLVDAGSFVIAASILARLPLVRSPVVARAAGFLTVLVSFRDWRYLALAALNSVLSLHMTLLFIGIPLWLIRATSAPASLVAVLMVVNTIMAVVLPVPFSRHATVAGGAPRVLRLAGVMLGACSVALALAAHVGPVAAVALLVAAVALLSLAENWQAAAAWELSYRYADAQRHVQYLAVFSLGTAAQDVFGPTLLTVVVIGAGSLGWLGIAAFFVVATLLVTPVTEALARASLAIGNDDQISRHFTTRRTRHLEATQCSTPTD